MYIPDNILTNNFDSLQKTEDPFNFFDKFHTLDTEAEIENFLFKNGIKVKNSFGSKEIFSYYTKKTGANKIFFPDAIFFSSKLRMIDLLRERRYATYSSFNKKVTLKKMKSWGMGFLSDTIIREVIHPYVLVNKESKMDSIIRKDSALVILPKSSPVCDRPWDSNLIKNLISTSRKFSEKIILLVYYQDLDKLNASNINNLCEENVNIASCGSRFDALFYYRLIYFMSKSNFIAYLEPGSHSIYAAYSNLKQLNLNVEVPTYISSGYQRSRYPKKNELDLFNKIISQYSDKAKPIEFEDLKVFLDNRFVYGHDNSGSTLQEVTYKTLRKIVLIYDKLQRKILK